MPENACHKYRQARVKEFVAATPSSQKGDGPESFRGPSLLDMISQVREVRFLISWRLLRRGEGAAITSGDEGVAATQ